MALVHRIPVLEALPELLVFYCPQCHEAQTIDARSGRLYARANQKIAA
jgi:hypothetical protein